MGLKCTLPRRNGKACGLVIHAFTGLQELEKLKHHIRSAHRHLDVLGDIRHVREQMERGEVPKHLNRDYPVEVRRGP